MQTTSQLNSFYRGQGATLTPFLFYNKRILVDMARSRVGGSKAKISGKVGSEVYSIVKNQSGGYTQVVSELPVSKEVAITPELCRQRMFMSIVMRHMSLLQAFLSAAFEDVPEGTLSVQEFARVNVRWLQQHYDIVYTNQYVTWWPAYGQSYALPAPIIISQGTFKQKVIGQTTRARSSSWGYMTVTFLPMYTDYTFGEWLEVHNFGMHEYICAMVFCLGEDGYTPSYEFVRFQVNPNVDLSQLCSRINPSDFFITAGTLPGSFRWSDIEDPESKRLLFQTEQLSRLRYMEGYTELQFGMQEGKWRQSNCQIFVSGWTQLGPNARLSYEQAFKTWYDDRI